MKATYSKQTGNYQITLNRKEAEALAYTFTSYSILLTALKTWPDTDSFHIYGSKAQVESDLAAAMKEGAEMSWYKVWMVVPGTDGDAENGPCEPQWWNDMVQATDEPSAIAAANAKARADWETSDGEIPSGRELGMECPICTGAQAVTDEEYAAWVKQMEDFEPLPFE